MAASSEVRFKIGGDTSALSKEFSSIPDKARSVGDRVRSAFGQLLPRKDAAASFSVFENAFKAAEEQALDLERTQAQSTRKSAASSAAVFEKQLRAADELNAAQDTLGTAKRRTAYEEANTVGKLKITTGELAALARQRNALGQGTVERLKIELQMEEKMRVLRSLQRNQGAANFLPTPAQVEARATGLFATIRRKFSGAGLAQGVLQGIGIGSVGTISDLVVAPFQRGAEQAKAMAALTSDLFGQTLRYIGAVGGATKQLEQQTKQVNELNRDIAAQRQLVADLNANPINFLTDGGRASITEAETGLNALIAKQAEIATNVQIAVLEENRRTAALQRSAVSARALAQLQLIDAAEGRKFAERRNALEIEGQALRKQGALPSVLQANRNAIAAVVTEEQLHNKAIKDRLADVARASRAQQEAAALELSSAGDRAKAQQKLNALRREYDVIVKRKGRGSPEAAENQMQQMGITNTLALLNKQAREAQSGALSGLGQSLTGGTVGRRSERERLADRGASRLAQADRAIRSGNSPAFVAQLAAQANRDFKSAGGKVAASTSGVASGDANDLGGQLVKANETLKAIEKNLVPQTLG